LWHPEPEICPCFDLNENNPVVPPGSAVDLSEFAFIIFPEDLISLFPQKFAGSHFAALSER
jgi:hypothetical protein